MYPFRFSFHALPHDASPFLLGKSQKSGLADVLLNVLLFVPFGFGVAEKLRECGKLPRFALIAALACGASFSYTIELLQLYIPERDSGWEDVFTNGSGSLVGSILYLLVGNAIVRVLSATHRSLVRWLTPVRIAWVLLAYFCFWFLLAAVLQKQSRLSNWKPEAILILGNDASERNPWRGQIEALQIWNHAIRGSASALPEPGEAAQGDQPIINYDFAALPESTSELQVVPRLFWIPAAPDRWESKGIAFDGKSWLSTKTNAGHLIESLPKTNQFTIHLVCTPEAIADEWGRIVYVSDADGVADIMIRQENAGLGFGFRTPLVSKRASLIWSVPNVFTDRRQHDILYSYDGSNLSLALDGQKQRLTYTLGPGTALARSIRRMKPAEFEGYNYIFYAMIFFAGGGLLGHSAPYGGQKFNVFVPVSSFLLFFAAAISLQFILACVSGSTFSPGSVVLAVVMGISGLLWSTSDRHFAQSPSVCSGKY
jgi:hypothetical protein